MKSIYSYIIEKLHLNKGLHISYEHKLKCLEEEIEACLQDTDGIGLNASDYHLYYADDIYNILDGRRLNETTMFVLFMTTRIQEQWGKSNKKKHDEIVSSLNAANFDGIERIEVAEHTYIKDRLKILVHLKRDS